MNNMSGMYREPPVRLFQLQQDSSGVAADLHVRAAITAVRQGRFDQAGIHVKAVQTPSDRNYMIMRTLDWLELVRKIDPDRAFIDTEFFLNNLNGLDHHLLKK